MIPKWLQWARRMQAISQSGLTFSKDAFDIERYEELKQMSAEIMAEYSNLELSDVEILFAKEKGYQTPKMDVRGAVFKENQILLVREKEDGRWSLPGGFCEVGRSPSENVVKEVQEESGFVVEAKRLLALMDMNKHGHQAQPFHYYKAFIECEMIGGNAEVGVETSDVRFFMKDKLPELSINRNTEEQIKALFMFCNHSTKQALFD